jgi:hypothetical protein
VNDTWRYNQHRVSAIMIERESQAIRMGIILRTSILSRAFDRLYQIFKLHQKWYGNPGDIADE